MEVKHIVHACCCGTEPAMPLHADSSSCCRVPRHFVTQAERREALEAYRAQLEKELAGLEERLSGLDT